METHVALGVVNVTQFSTFLALALDPTYLDKNLIADGLIPQLEEFETEMEGVKQRHGFETNLEVMKNISIRFFFNFF